MNPEQISGAVRVLVALALAPGSYLVAKGIVPADQAATLVPAITTIVTVVGGAVVGYFANRSHSATAIVAAVNSDSAPGVKVVPESSPSPQVSVTPAGAIIPTPTPPGPKP
jgi:hypothetical protein